MRDDQVARYARHFHVPGIGREGQERLLASTAHVVAGSPAAEIAATFLSAGGVIVERASAGVDAPGSAVLEIPDRPAWWPGPDIPAGDDTALAMWRGGAAAAHWMAKTAKP